MGRVDHSYLRVHMASANKFRNDLQELGDKNLGTIELLAID